MQPAVTSIERRCRGGGSAIELWRADDNGATLADSELQAEAFRALRGEPALECGGLRVDVAAGALTLSGGVGSYLEKVTAGRVARALPGVRLVRNLIRVQPASWHQRSDAELRFAAAQMLDWNVLLAHAKLEVRAVAGWVLLEGELNREWERRAAEESVELLVGMRGVTNMIKVKS